MTDGAGPEHVAVDWSAEPAHSAGFPVCHEDGEPDEGAQDEVQTDRGGPQDHYGQKLQGELYRVPSQVRPILHINVYIGVK